VKKNRKSVFGARFYHKNRDKNHPQENFPQSKNRGGCDLIGSDLFIGRIKMIK
jgi:hypothetical protein